MFGLGGFTLWDFIVVGWYHAWDRVRAHFPGATPSEIVRREDIRPHPDTDWYPYAPGILLRWRGNCPEMKTTDGQLIESVEIIREPQGTLVKDLRLVRSK